jgi:D-galactarolactone cycloisomerase
MNPPKIDRIECHVYRAPTELPLRTSFGMLTDRPATFLRVIADDGAYGWGEVFSNFPQVGAEHRARLVASIFNPLLAGRACDAPGETWRWLEQSVRRIAIQCGEPGPFAQIIGAIDQALWDIQARRLGLPLWKLLAQGLPAGTPAATGRVRAYASGLGPTAVGEMAAAKYAEGYRAFKFKVGFGQQIDQRNFREMRDAVGSDATVMIDVNQGWDPETAAARIDELLPFSPFWVEEPLAADEPIETWQALAHATGAPIAAGENIRGFNDFDAALRAGYLRHVQPDVAKWGGISGCLQVGLLARELGVDFCPHWLGGGIGLAASLHLRASLGEQGWAEIDANTNPLRQQVCPLVIHEGWVELPQTPGIGVDPTQSGIESYRVTLT